MSSGYNLTTAFQGVLPHALIWFIAYYAGKPSGKRSKRKKRGHSRKA